MSTLTRSLSAAVLAIGVTCLQAAEAPKDSPFTQAGAAAPAGSQLDNLEFAGVSTVGKKTMINLFDKQDKRNFWVEAGTTSGGITVVKYDSAHDQITVRQNGTEKLLPLRAPSAVVNGTTPVPAPVAPAPVPAVPTATATPTTQLSQARQEEEARMLVSDLLEIGMAQRRAYEEAQRKAAGQPTGAPAAPTTAQPGTEPAQPGATPTGAATAQTAQPVDPAAAAAAPTAPQPAPTR